MELEQKIGGIDLIALGSRIKREPVITGRNTQDSGPNRINLAAQGVGSLDLGVKKEPEPRPKEDVQEYIIKIPKENIQKKYSVMRFNHSHKVDIVSWMQAKLERENNYKEYKLDNEDNPKFGAGSEFGREQRDESRRKKHGIITKKYNPEDQPWLLKLGGKNGKRYKGLREGGVTENASYYMFTQAADGTFEAIPISEWYNFTPFQCYKALSPEEAEEAYGRREKVFNYFSIMTQKRLKNETGDDDDEEKKTKGKSKKSKSKEFKITDFDELGNTLDSDESQDSEQEDEKPTKKNGKKKNKKKKKEDNTDDEAIEESDEGDFDDKEVDYITSSSSSDEELGEEEKTNRDLKGVEDEEALRKLMSEDEEEEGENPDENKEPEENAETKDKTTDSKAKQKAKKSDSSGDSSSESSDSDFDDPKFTSAIFVPNFQKSKKKTGSDNSGGSSRANTPTKLQSEKDSSKSMKRKMGDAQTSTPGKKQKLENPKTQAVPSSSSSNLDVNEETVRRYLQRKPMTASDLLHKFKSKRTKMSSQQLVQRIADVLKRMDLQKTNIKGKMYLSLKNT